MDLQAGRNSCIPQGTSMDFKGKTALVTGGCGGLGAAIAKAFLDAGANVVAIDINPVQVTAFSKAHEATHSGKVLALECDITDEASLTKLFDSALSRFGTIEAVVNNAGIMDRIDAVGTLDRSLWDKVITVNLTAPYMVSKCAVNHMLEKDVRGAIVNIASAAAHTGFAAGKRWRQAGSVRSIVTDSCHQGPHTLRANTASWA